MKPDPFVRNKEFLDCVDRCHKAHGDDVLGWPEAVECVERCWRRYARV